MYATADSQETGRRAIVNMTFSLACLASSSLRLSLDYSVCGKCDAVSQTCVLKSGSYECECNNGWLPNGSLCSNINECASCKLCDPNALCNDTLGSFYCECHSGWTGDGFTCIDIDECQGSSPCSEYANCTNTNGSYECTCHIGYKGNGTYCAVNEGSVSISGR